MDQSRYKPIKPSPEEARAAAALLKKLSRCADTPSESSARDIETPPTGE